MTTNVAHANEPFISKYGSAGMFSRVTFSTCQEQNGHCRFYLKHLETSVASLNPIISILAGEEFSSVDRSKGHEFWNYADALERWAEYAKSRDFFPGLANKFWEILVPQIFTGQPTIIKSASALPVARNLVVDLGAITESEVVCSTELLTFALAHQYFLCLGGQNVSQDPGQQSADILLNARFGCNVKVIFTGKHFSIQRDTRKS